MTHKGTGNKSFAIIGNGGEYVKNSEDNVIMFSPSDTMSGIENKEITYKSVTKQFSKHWHMTFEKAEFKPYFEYLFTKFDKLEGYQKAWLNRMAILYLTEDNPWTNVPDNAFLYKSPNENKGRSMLWLMSSDKNKLKYVKWSGKDGKGDQYYLWISYSEQIFFKKNEILWTAPI